MTIRKKWILTLGMIAVISIVVNSIVLSGLTSHYFNNYLDEKYNQKCKKMVEYLAKELSDGNYSQSRIQVELETYLGDSVTQIKVYDTAGTLIASSEEGMREYSGRGMNMMQGMMRDRTSGYTVVDDLTIKGTSGKIGEVHVTRYSASGNSYTAILFQNSLFRNSLISLGIVMVLVFLLGFLMSRRMSKDLVETADMAQNIDLGNEEKKNYSKTMEIRIIQKSLESLGARLRLKQKARKTLIDEMVHQTRTPLTILKMHLEGIEDGVIDLKDEEIKVCENQIDNLTDIILNMSNLIDAGTNEKHVVVEDFELSQFVKQIMNGMKAQFQKKNIDFKLLPSEKIHVRTDQYRLGQAIYNILTNAYKFTPAEGSVRISFWQEQDMVRLEIADSGCGIRKEDQANVFDAYYRKDNTSGEGEGGDGIGLFIAKENMECLYGRIEVDSKEGKGSKFSLVFPSEMNI